MRGKQSTFREELYYSAWQGPSHRQPLQSACQSFFLAPIENQADRPECPKVKMTHSTDLNNTNKQPGDLRGRAQTWLPLCPDKHGVDEESEEWHCAVTTFLCKTDSDSPLMPGICWTAAQTIRRSRPSYLRSGAAGHTARPLLDLHGRSLDFFSGSWSSPSLFTTTQKQ